MALSTVDTTPGTAPAPAPVVLILPAHDEEAAVGGVVARVPAQVCGRPVECVVVDDGSTDRTAVVAAAAGATVVSLGRNRGLGAAVRVGLAEGVAPGCRRRRVLRRRRRVRARGARRAGARRSSRARPTTSSGSRFTGRIERMHPHRRFGNRVLTWALRRLARKPITDGQSGYRALSLGAATAAEIVHDFNYAQVLTLDLLARGFRYEEVPISYHFRETGTSFVRLGPYLRAVVPAVWRQWRTHSLVVQSSTTWDRNTSRAADQELVSS